MFPQFPLPAVRNHIELLLGFYVDVSQRMLETVQNLSALNLQLGRDIIAEIGTNTQRIMASKDASQLSSAIAAQFAPGATALHTYQQRLTQLISQCQANVSQSAVNHMPAVRRSASALAEGMVEEAAAQTSRAAEQLARFQPGSHLRH